MNDLPSPAVRADLLTALPAALRTAATRPRTRARGTRRQWMLGVLCLMTGGAAMADTSGWQTLARRSGHLVIMRHALAPGVGDPPGLRLGDCATQRNLSDEGRAQARAVGVRLREAGLQGAQVYSSQWCRTLETARALDLGTVRELPALNSFFGQAQEQRDTQMRDLRAWIARADLSRPTVLVTHQVVMTGLTGEYAASAEALVLRRERDGVKVVGRFATPY